jgi:hypothetical protein
MNFFQFKQLLQTVADGWNTGNPKKAADCFSHDAVYMEPPDKQLVKTYEQLFKYFGGDEPKQMTLVWHQLMFDEDTQVGSGEFTFQIEGSDKNHGMVIVELDNDKIKFWREYYKISTLEFEEFISLENKHFEFEMI